MAASKNGSQASTSADVDSEHVQMFMVGMRLHQHVKSHKELADVLPVCTHILTNPELAEQVPELWFALARAVQRAGQELSSPQLKLSLSEMLSAQRTLTAAGELLQAHMPAAILSETAWPLLAMKLDVYRTQVPEFRAPFNDDTRRALFKCLSDPSGIAAGVKIVRREARESIPWNMLRALNACKSQGLDVGPMPPAFVDAVSNWVGQVTVSSMLRTELQGWFTSLDMPLPSQLREGGDAVSTTGTALACPHPDVLATLEVETGATATATSNHQHADSAAEQSDDEVGHDLTDDEDATFMELVERAEAMQRPGDDEDSEEPSGEPVLLKAGADHNARKGSSVAGVTASRGRSPGPGSKDDDGEGEEEGKRAHPPALDITLPPPPSDVARLTHITEYLQTLHSQLQAAVPEDYVPGRARGRQWWLTVDSHTTLELHVSRALRMAAELWRAEPMPSITQLHELQQLARQGDSLAGLDRSSSDEESQDDEEEEGLELGALSHLELTAADSSGEEGEEGVLALISATQGSDEDEEEGAAQPMVRYNPATGGFDVVLTSTNSDTDDSPEAAASSDVGGRSSTVGLGRQPAQAHRDGKPELEHREGVQATFQPATALDLAKILMEQDAEDAEEEAVIAAQMEVYLAERDALVTAAGQVLAISGPPTSSEGMTTVLWALVALDVRWKSRGPRAEWRTWVNMCSIMMGEPKHGWFMRRVVENGYLPATVLGLNVLGGLPYVRCQGVLAARAVHCMTRSKDDRWPADTVCAAVGPLLQALDMRRGDDRRSARQLIEACGVAIVAAFKHDRANSDTSASSLAQWLTQHAPKECSLDVFKALSYAVEHVGVDTALVIAQLAVSYYVDVAGDQADDPGAGSQGSSDRRGSPRPETSSGSRLREQQAATLRTMIRTLGRRAQQYTVLGVNAAQGVRALAPVKAVSLAGLVATRLPGAAARPDASDRRLATDICEALRGRVSQLDVESLFVTARLLHESDGLLRDDVLSNQVTLEASKRAKQLSGDELAQCLLSQSDPFTPLKGDAHMIFNSTHREARAKMGECTMDGLLKLLAAIARLHRDDLTQQYATTFMSVCDVVVSRLGEATLQDSDSLVRVAQAFLRGRLYHAPLLRKLCLSAANPDIVKRASKHCLAKVLMCIAMLAYDFPEAQKAFAVSGQGVSRHADTLGPWDLADVCWACAVANQAPLVKPSDAWKSKRAAQLKAVRRSMEGGGSAKLAPVTLAHVLTAEVLARVATEGVKLHVEGAEARSRDELSVGSMKYALRIWAVMRPDVRIPKRLWIAMQDSNQGTSTSDTQRDVTKLLRQEASSLGLSNIKSEANIGHEWVVDLTARHSSNRTLVIEVDGPWHSTTNDSTRLLGGTAIRNHVAQRLGHVLVSISLLELGNVAAGGGRPALARIQTAIQKALDAHPLGKMEAARKRVRQTAAKVKEVKTKKKVSARR